MKRLSHCWEQVISEENCIAAVHDMLRGKRRRALYAGLQARKRDLKAAVWKRAMSAKPKRDKVQYYRDHLDDIGRQVAQDLMNGTWTPSPYREKKIYDGIRGKVRTIRVPCLYDQVVHHAVMRVTAPEILRRNYYYNCGSIPKAGQTRAIKAVKRWMGRNPPKYALVLDVSKFYDKCSHDVVMCALRRMYKDRRFLTLHEQVLDSMGQGLAIGFYPSQWYANLVLGTVDMAIKQRLLPDCRYVRYMDDMVLLHNNKRKLHRARTEIEKLMISLSLKLKGNWQVYKIKPHGVAFLSYRFFCGYTLIRKPLMYRLARRMKSAAKSLTPHSAMAVMSYIGILKHCNSFNFMQKHVRPFVQINKCKGVIRYAAKLCRACSVPAAV